MSGFINGLIEHTREFESPRSFWEWSAIASIAAVLRDNIYLLDGDSELYPNLYILFLAGPAARKNRPVAMSERMLRKINNTKIISGRNSIQAILDELARTETSASSGKLVFKPGTAIFYAPELAGALVQSDDSVNILTDIYDGKTDFASRLRHSPNFKIDRIVFSAFMASNEVMLRSVFDGRATHGGLLSRTCLIVPDEFRKGNDLMDQDPKEEERRREEFDALVGELKKISLLHGRMFYTPEAVDAHRSWYHPFRSEYMRKGDSAGVLGRTHTMIKKVSACLAANDLVMAIEGPHMRKAIEMCMSLLPNYNSFIMASGKSDIAEACTLVLKALFEASVYTMSKREILASHWQDIDSPTLDSVLITLEEGRIIKSVVSDGGVSYQLTMSTVDKMKGKPS